MKSTIDLDIPETTIKHGEIIKNKPFLRKLYTAWYQGFIDTIDSIEAEGKVLELGSGGGFLKELYPDVITSDILELPECDICCAADHVPFPDKSLKGVFMLDVLHHLPNVEDFLREMDRTLMSKGIIYMIEPANTPMSSIIFKHFHHEDFDPKVKEWAFTSYGPLSSSNQALPWIIFNRDRKIFEQKFPSLQIRSIRLHTPFKYLISGGLSYNTPIPGWSYAFFNAVENVIKPVFRYCAMFQTIILEKK